MIIVLLFCEVSFWFGTFGGIHQFQRSFVHVNIYTKGGVKFLLKTKQETKRITEFYPGQQVELASKINLGEASYDQKCSKAAHARRPT